MTNKFQGVEQRKQVPESWHLKKEVNISMLLGLLGLAVGIIASYYDTKRDIALLQADNAVLHQRSGQQASDLKEAIAMLQTQYRQMDGKLDRLIERSLR